MSLFFTHREDNSLRVRLCASNERAVSIEIKMRGTVLYQVLPRLVFEAVFIGEDETVSCEGGCCDVNEKDGE